MKKMLMALWTMCAFFAQAMELPNAVCITEEIAPKKHDDPREFFTEKKNKLRIDTTRTTVLTYDLANSHGHSDSYYENQSTKSVLAAKVDWVETKWKPQWYGARYVTPIASILSVDFTNKEFAKDLMVSIEKRMKEQFPSQIIELVWDGDSHDQQSENTRSFLKTLGFVNRGGYLSKEVTNGPLTGQSPR